MSLKKPEVMPSRRFWTAQRLALTMSVFVLLVSVGLSSCNSREETPATTNTSAETASRTTVNTLPPVVLDSELRSLNGQPIKLSDYSGKVLLVNLWATWCGPCRREIPELVKLHKEFKAKGFEVVGLSTENPDASVNDVRDFVRAYSMDYAVGWISEDVAIALMRGNGNIPQSFVIARDGRILRRFIGFSSVSTPPQLRRVIEDALKT
jgi:thiol-disulfide isomerase/thioredoxin